MLRGGPEERPGSRVDIEGGLDPSSTPGFATCFRDVFLITAMCGW